MSKQPSISDVAPHLISTMEPRPLAMYAGPDPMESRPASAPAVTIATTPIEPANVRDMSGWAGGPPKHVARNVSAEPYMTHTSDPRGVHGTSGIGGDPGTYAGPQGYPVPGDKDWKDNNPKDAFGALKVDYTTTMYMPVLYEMSVGMAAGGYKYGMHNYLAVAPSAMVYVGAAKRHLDAFVGGEMMDPNAGPDVKVRHVIAAMNSLHVLAAALINGRWVDDRPPAMPPGFIDNLNEQMVILKRNNPDPVARYLSEGRRGPGRILESKT